MSGEFLVSCVDGIIRLVFMYPVRLLSMSGAALALADTCIVSPQSFFTGPYGGANFALGVPVSLLFRYLFFVSECPCVAGVFQKLK